MPKYVAGEKTGQRIGIMMNVLERAAFALQKQHRKLRLWGESSPADLKRADDLASIIAGITSIRNKLDREKGAYMARREGESTIDSGTNSDDTDEMFAKLKERREKERYRSNSTKAFNAYQAYLLCEIPDEKHALKAQFVEYANLLPDEDILDLRVKIVSDLGTDPWEDDDTTTNS
jgi:hypothetical protein